MPAVNITSFAYIPLAFSSPQVAPALIKSVEDEVDAMKKSGSLPPGLAEQYDIQLKNLRDPEIPDLEVVVFPGYFAGNGTSLFLPSTSHELKNYM